LIYILIKTRIECENIHVKANADASNENKNGKHRHIDYKINYFGMKKSMKRKK